MADRYKVDVGRTDGKAGDTLQIQASSEADARSQALNSDQLLDNPSWEIQGIYKEV